MNWLLVALGGSLGAVCRYALDKSIGGELGSTLLGTFAANISGSLLLGIFMGIASARVGWPQSYNLLFAVGFCGSFTTFSTVTVASIKIMEDGDYLKALLNVGGSVFVGLIAAFLGLWIGRHAF